MEFEKIVQELNSGKFRPIYFLHGLESYFIDKISDFIEDHALTESEKAFNQSVFYGKEVDHLAVVDAARRYPMMAARQLVMLKEAQEMKSLANLLTYIERPSETTILVICHKHKKYNLNSNFGKALKSNALIFESKPLYDNQMPDWVSKYLKEKNLKISPMASALITEYLGTDLSKVANELDKLAINIAAGATINEQIVEQQIGISKDYNVFEFQKAIGQKEIIKVNKMIQYFASNAKNNPVQVIIGSLASFFSKIYGLHFLNNKPESEILDALNLRSAFFLKDYKTAARNFPVQKTEEVIGMLKEYDLKSKGVGFNSTGKKEGELLKELVWKILH